MVARYKPYLQRQANDLAAFMVDENLVLPIETDYSQIEGLSNEAKDRLGKGKPISVVSLLFSLVVVLMLLK